MTASLDVATVTTVLGLWALGLYALLSQNWQQFRRWLRPPRKPAAVRSRQRRQIPVMVGLVPTLAGIACLAGAQARPEWVIPGMALFAAGCGLMVSGLMRVADAEDQDARDISTRPLPPRLRMPRVAERHREPHQAGLVVTKSSAAGTVKAGENR